MWWFPDTPLGQGIFLASKLWLLVLPLVWHRLVDGGSWSWSPPRRGGWGVAVVSGLVISALVVAAYLFLGPRLVDLARAAEEIRAVGFSSPTVLVAGALYWIVVNAVLEEYVWRWFVVRQSEAATGGPRRGILLAAVGFTIHHVVAVAAFLPPLATALASLGVFVGGCWWSFMYTRYRSIWPGYLSHALVDVAVFASAGHLLFVR